MVVGQSKEQIAAYLRDAQACLERAACGDTFQIGAARYKLTEVQRLLSSPTHEPATAPPPLERDEWTPQQALEFYAAGRHFDVVNGRTRILDTGAIASDALKQISADYASMKGLVNGESDPASAQPPGARHDFREEAIETISDAITDQLGHDDDVLAGVILEALVEENMIVGGPYFAAPPPVAPCVCPYCEQPHGYSTATKRSDAP
jgi:hypothetical protein